MLSQRASFLTAAEKKDHAKMTKAPFIIRNYLPQDFDNYVRLHEEIEVHDRAGRYLSELRLTEDLGHPRFDPQTNLFVAEQDGNFIGYFSVFLEPEIGRALLDGAIHPSHRRRGIATALFDGAVRHAGQAGLNIAQICIPQSNEPAQKMATGLGMKYIRHFIGFELDLADSQIPEAPPGDYNIRHLRPGEESQLTGLQNLAFAGAWGFNPNTTEEIIYRVHLNSSTAEGRAACRILLDADSGQ